MIRSIALALCLSAAALSAQDAILSDIQVGGTYVIIMKPGILTNDTLRGTIEDKTDTSIIIDAAGTPYLFKPNLIASYSLIAGPKNTNAVNEGGFRVFTWEEVMNRAGSIKDVQVKLSNGSVFKGSIEEIDSFNVKVNVAGSIIPISRDIVAELFSALPVTPQKPDLVIPEEPKAPELPPDSIWIKQNDEYGQPAEPILMIGRVTGEVAGGYSFTSTGGTTRSFKYEEIVNIVRHVADTYEEKLRRYAMPLSCPPDMVLSDITPGLPDKPFFRTCVDKYEYPNQRDVMPATNVSYMQADSMCKSKGKRLCTADEWQWSCSGLDGSPYPYGPTLSDPTCNRTTIVETSGTRPKCAGKLGVADMTGNVFEWVTGNDRKPVVMGGPMSKCQTVSPSPTGAAKPSFGFRCCKSN